MRSPCGPGNWPIKWDATPATEKVDAGLRATVGPLAVQALWAATGRRFGLVTHTHVAHPSRPGWYCEPTHNAGILLPGPVYEVLQVVAGTVTYPHTDYALRGDFLLHTVSPWPRQTTVITYMRGAPVPVGGDVYAAVLAAEIVSGIKGGKCRLPSRATSVAREGVNIVLANPEEYLQEGLTGIPEVDQWITTHNPHRLKTDSVAWSPDGDPGTTRYRATTVVDSRRSGAFSAYPMIYPVGP